MTWTPSAIPGVYTSGFYRVNRTIQGYEAWFTSPKAFRLVGKVDYLADAKALCEQDRAK
jgi:hypothetical protein